VYAHSVVRQIAYVIVAGAGRVDDPICRIVIFVNNGTHNTFGSRRATYIAKANKQYLSFFHIII
jgi:hypothetical protein